MDGATMEGLTKLLSVIGAGGTALATLWGGASFVDTRYAHAPELADVRADVQWVELRLDGKISADHVNQMQARIWRLEDRYGEDFNTWPDTAKEEFRELQQRKQDLQRHLQSLEVETRQKDLNRAKPAGKP